MKVLNREIYNNDNNNRMKCCLPSPVAVQYVPLVCQVNCKYMYVRMYVSMYIYKYVSDKACFLVGFTY